MCYTNLCFFLLNSLYYLRNKLLLIPEAKNVILVGALLSLNEFDQAI